jgi:hypothetical protein
LKVRNGTGLENVHDHRIDVWGKHLYHLKPNNGGANDLRDLGNRLSIVVGDLEA